MSATFAEGKIEYESALKLGKKDGGSPLVLDTILRETGLTSPREIPLGVQDIVMEQIVGTKTEGRKNSFSKSFYPLMPASSEFGNKWASLCQSHLEEGIHDPIKVYEYMNQYYVMEGNKRVSVLRYFDSYSISADVIRILPPLIDTPEIHQYYAYVDFYNLSKINYLYFTKPLSFSKLQRLVGKKRNEPWTYEDRKDFDSFYSRFHTEYTKLFGAQDYRMVSDAFLSFITVYDYGSMVNASISDLKQALKKYASEFKLLFTPDSSALLMDPVSKEKTLIDKVLPKLSLHQKVAFIHDKSPERSAWTFNHDAGRRYIEQTFKDEITTTVYNGTDLGNIRETLDKAIAANHQVIFTTSPIFLKETLRAAVEHPEIKFLCCAPYLSYKHVRTYYARMHEVKFLLGAIAGAMAANDKIGYIADYPILGTVSNINAFALGAKMINPRAKIYLKWSTSKVDSGAPVPLDSIYEYFRENDISIICDKDSQNHSICPERIGLYQVNEGGIWNMALPIWNWGVFYEKTISNILDGTWKTEAQSAKEKGIRYWWGMSSELVNILPSGRLPIGTIRLIELLKNQIQQGDFNPFTGILFSQKGVIQSSANATLSPEEILTMDWLAENIIGEIPAKDSLTDPAQLISSFVGVNTEELVL